MRGEPRGAGDVVGEAVRRFLVRADVDADDPLAAGAGLEPVGHCVEPLAVEAEAVDHRPVAGEAEHPRARIAGLGLRHDSADLDEAETEAEQRIGHPRALVEPGGEADRIGKALPEQLDGQGRIVGRRTARRQQRQAANRQVVRRLGVEPVQQRPGEGEERVDHACGISAGNTCRPSGPRGMSVTERTALKGRSP